MINNLIAALIALGFLHRNMDSEDSKKIQNASWTKVFVFFVLSSITLVAFYKTYQVATIKSQIYVHGIRGAMANNDSTQNIEIGDTVSIVVNNVFNSDRIKYRDLKEVPDAEKPLFVSTKMGGTSLQFKLNNESKYHIENYPGIKEEDFIKEGVKNINGTGHLYYVRLINNEIPMLLPFLPEAEYMDYGLKTTPYPDSTLAFSRLRSMSLDNYIPAEGLKYFGENGAVSLIERGTEHPSFSDSLKRIYATAISASVNYNTMNFLTAADLTQCSYEFNIYSTCPVDYLQFYFNIPVEISPLSFKVDTLNAYGFQITDSTTISRFNTINDGHYGKGIKFHLKLPTLSNMQLIRSLILTTLLTTFISLLLSSFYYRLKKTLYIVYRKKEKLITDPYKRIESKSKILKICSYSLLCIITFIIYKLGRLVLFDTPLKIGYSKWDTFVISTPIIIVLFILLSLYIFNRIIKDEKKKKKNN
jgi:hypothetical protein